MNYACKTLFLRWQAERRRNYYSGKNLVVPKLVSSENMGHCIFSDHPNDRLFQPKALPAHGLKQGTAKGRSRLFPKLSAMNKLSCLAAR